MEYLSLQEYRDIAGKLLNKSFPKFASDIMGDDEKFGTIVSTLAVADWEFDGRGSLYGYRKQRVYWAIIALYKKQPDYSLNFSITEGLELVDTIPNEETYDEIEYKDRQAFLSDKITNSKVLTEKEKTCISQYLTQGIELAEIATNLGAHKESVKMAIRRGLTKLGLHTDYVERFEKRQSSRRKGKTEVRGNGVKV